MIFHKKNQKAFVVFQTKGTWKKVILNSNYKAVGKLPKIQVQLFQH